MTVWLSGFSSYQSRYTEKCPSLTGDSQHTAASYHHLGTMKIFPHPATQLKLDSSQGLISIFSLLFSVSPCAIYCKVFNYFIYLFYSTCTLPGKILIEIKISFTVVMFWFIITKWHSNSSFFMQHQPAVNNIKHCGLLILIIS